MRGVRQARKDAGVGLGLGCGRRRIGRRRRGGDNGHNKRVAVGIVILLVAAGMQRQPHNGSFRQHARRGRACILIAPRRNPLRMAGRRRRRGDSRDRRGDSWDWLRLPLASVRVVGSGAAMSYRHSYGARAIFTTDLLLQEKIRGEASR